MPDHGIQRSRQDATFRYAGAGHRACTTAHRCTLDGKSLQHMSGGPQRCYPGVCTCMQRQAWVVQSHSVMRRRDQCIPPYAICFMQWFAASCLEAGMHTSSHDWWSMLEFNVSCSPRNASSYECNSRPEDADNTKAVDDGSRFPSDCIPKFRT